MALKCWLSIKNSFYKKELFQIHGLAFLVKKNKK